MFMQVVKYACCQILLVIVFTSIGHGIFYQCIFYSVDVKERTVGSVPFIHLSVTYQMMARKYAKTRRTEYNRTKSCCFLKFLSTLCGLMLLLSIYSILFFLRSRSICLLILARLLFYLPFINVFQKAVRP